MEDEFFAGNFSFSDLDRSSIDSKELVEEVVENLLTSIVTKKKTQKQSALVPLYDVFHNTPLSSFSCNGCSKSYSIDDSFSVDLKCQTMLISCSQCLWWTKRQIALASTVYRLPKNPKLPNLTPIQNSKVQTAISYLNFPDFVPHIVPSQM